MSEPFTTRDLWDLRASPSAVQSFAEAWAKSSEAAHEAVTTVDRAVRDVLSDEAWSGVTAEAYDAHRKQASRDLEQFADKAKAIARQLEELAETLRFNQGALDDARQPIDAITVSGDDELTFEPDNDAELELLRTATVTANEIRDRVDEKLAAVQRSFDAIAPDLEAIGEAWAPRSIRVMDMNVFQGGDGNELGNIEGTDQRDIPSLGRKILDNEVDVATLQETFEGDMNALRDYLNDNSPPGEHWELQFSEGTTATQQPDSDDGEPLGDQSFGNAILVREGGAIQNAHQQDDTELEEDGDIEGRAMGRMRLDLSDQ